MLFLVLTITQASVQAQHRIIFLGDSITEAGANPGGYVALAADSLQKLGTDIVVQGAGISGNKVPDLLERLDTDVLAYEPTHVVIYIGINDVWHHFEFDHVTGTDPETFEHGLGELIDRIEQADAVPLLCTPSVIGEDTGSDSAVNIRLQEYAQISRRAARDKGVHLCGLRAAFEAYLTANNPDKAYKGVLTSDGVHLNADGNRFVANFMVQQLRSVLEL
jgi:lysophospholipase L1-like esterase